MAAGAISPAMIYIVSGFILYIMITIVVFIIFRRPILDEFRRKFLIKKGYGYVEISGNDRQVREHFLSLKKGEVKVDDCIYFIDPKKARTKNKAGYYEFKHGVSEPVNVYDPNIIGTDANFLDGFMLKCKLLAKVQAYKDMQFILYASIGAAVMAGIAALLAYTDYNTLQDIAAKLIK